MRIEDLPRLAVPIVDFIDEERPDVVIGCDRGARLFSLAVYSMWRESRDERFPTLDGKIHFAKVSNSLSKKQQRGQLQHVIDRSKARTKQDKPLHVLFLDDKVRFGNTLMTARRSFSEVYRAQHEITFATMFGIHGDVVASEENYGRLYNDDPTEIGIDYEFRHDERGILQPIPINTMTDAARNNRAAIIKASEGLGKDIRGEANARKIASQIFQLA